MSDDTAPTPKGWGGRRAGAGAPRGNLNGLRHGRNSPRLKAYIRAIAEDKHMQTVILEFMRIAVRGADIGALIRNACLGLEPVAVKQRHARSRQHESVARAARKIERLIAGIPPETFPEPPPTLILGDDGNPRLVTNEITGAPFNPITGEHERIHPGDPRTLTRAHRRVHRMVKRQYNRDLVDWARRTFGRPTP